MLTSNNLLLSLTNEYFSELSISSREGTLTRDFIITKTKELAFEEKMVTIFFPTTPAELDEIHSFFHVNFYQFIRFADFADTDHIKEYYTYSLNVKTFNYETYINLVLQIEDLQSLCNYSRIFEVDVFSFGLIFSSIILVFFALIFQKLLIRTIIGMSGASFSMAITFCGYLVLSVKEIFKFAREKKI
jgi:hypothetical protein